MTPIYHVLNTEHILIESVSVFFPVPGFLGQKYTDVYSRMEPNLPEGYQWAGTQRKREQLANNLAAQREHDRCKEYINLHLSSFFVRLTIIVPVH